MIAELDILIAGSGRDAALAVTLAGLCGQRFKGFRVVIAEPGEAAAAGEVGAVLRVLRAHGHDVEVHSHPPYRGLARQRRFLLQRTRSRYALFLDEDLILEPDVVASLLHAMRQQRCGFVGQAPIRLSALNDAPPQELAIEFWYGPVTPETVLPGAPAWERRGLHEAANLYHLQRRLALDPARPRPYRIAWIDGCVLYDTARLRTGGGFDHRGGLPAASGVDAAAQLRLMARHGGCGLIPSGVYRQEPAVAEALTQVADMYEPGEEAAHVGC